MISLDPNAPMAIKLRADEFQALRPLALRAMSDFAYRHHVFEMLNQMGISKRPDPDSTAITTAFSHLALRLEQGYTDAVKKISLGEIEISRPLLYLLIVLVISTKPADISAMEKDGVSTDALIRASISLNSQMMSDSKNWLNPDKKKGVTSFMMPSNLTTLN